MNVTPPKSYDEWGLLIENFVNHLIIRYGINEIRTWYFEVWNEPNLEGFWTGTKQDYFRFYEVCAREIKSADKSLKVGGPATARCEWVGDLINYCSQNKVPLDFISTHLYPQDEFGLYPDKTSDPYDTAMFFINRIKEMESTVRKSFLPGLEIHMTEWCSLSSADRNSVSWTKNKNTDNVFSAAFIVNSCVSLDKDVNSLAYWTASDIFEESGFKNKPFNNHYGLLTVDGIPKASYNAFFFLDKMSGDLLNVRADTKLPSGCGVAAVKESDHFRILIWNHLSSEIKSRFPWQTEIRIPLQPSEDYMMTSARIKVNAGSAYETWISIGAPDNLTPIQAELLKQHATPEYDFEKISPTGFNNRMTLKSNEVVLLEFVPGKCLSPVK